MWQPQQDLAPFDKLKITDVACVVNLTCVSASEIDAICVTSKTKVTRTPAHMACNAYA